MYADLGCIKCTSENCDWVREKCDWVWVMKVKNVSTVKNEWKQWVKMWGCGFKVVTEV